MDTEQLEDVARETYSRTEEWLNTLTHGGGAALSLAGLVYLLIAVSTGGWLRVTSLATYGTSLLFLYTSSTLYHAWPDTSVKDFFQKLDHAAIFVLIAGTYTPFTLVLLEPAWGWPLFGIVWTTATVGMVLKLTDIGTHKWLDVAIYLTLGWIGIVAFPQLTATIPVYAFVLLLAGGIVYSTGTIFYVWDGMPMNHAVWHLFVLGGSALHFTAIALSIG